MRDDCFAFALHGGAGVLRGRAYPKAEALMAALVLEAEQRMRKGDAALDIVEHAVAAMEASGLFVAGRGSGRNSAGYVEHDASIMDGARLRAGAVGAARDLAAPIAVARAVMERTPHVFLAGPGAGAFAAAQGFEIVAAPEKYYIVPEGVTADEQAGARAHGTVGAVARDRNGALAAATSTGGVFGKREGRLGDSPMIGAGTWADDLVAVSCTGLGEAFILANVAADVSARMRYGGAGLHEAAAGALALALARGGDGGLIAVDRSGAVAMPYNSDGMKRGVVGADISAQVGSFALSKIGESGV